MKVCASRTPLLTLLLPLLLAGSVSAGGPLSPAPPRSTPPLAGPLALALAPLVPLVPLVPLPLVALVALVPLVPLPPLTLLAPLPAA
jgi:hypothetical protein